MCKKTQKCHTSNRKFCMDCIAKKALAYTKNRNDKKKLIQVNEPPDVTLSKEQGDVLRYLVESRRREEESLCVIYTPDCGCPVEQFVLLDRFPMSKKIRGVCPECKKGCLMEIIDPIRFHLPMTDQDYELKDLVGMHVTDTYQKNLILAYQAIAKDLLGVE